MNLTLIGMPGAGKSYVGKRLADRRKLEFLDTDDLLAQKYGKPIQAQLEELGPDAYLDREAETIVEVTAGKDNILLSPGGSIIYRPQVVAHAKRNSKIVYLCVPQETIEERLKNCEQRAIVGLGTKSLKQLYEERTPLYERAADLIVDCETLDLSGVLDQIDNYLALTEKAAAVH